MSQSKAKPLPKAKTYAESTKTDRIKAQKSAGESRVAGSASNVTSTNQSAVKTTSTQVKVVTNTSAVPQGKADTTDTPEQKELEKQSLASSAPKTKKTESFMKPITASKKKPNDSEISSISRYMSKSTPVQRERAAEAKTADVSTKYSLLTLHSSELLSPWSLTCSTPPGKHEAN